MSNLSEHSIIVSATTAVAVLSVCSGITFTWIVPTMTASMSNKLEAEIARTKELLAQKVGLESEIAELEARVQSQLSSAVEAEKMHEQVVAGKDEINTTLKRKLFELQKLNVFTSGSPYPFDYDKIRLGDPIDRVFQLYKGVKSSVSSNHVSYKFKSDLFDRVTYSFNVEKRDIVEGISFDIGKFRGLIGDKEKLPPSWMEDSLTRALGTPIIEIGPDKQCLVWRVDHMNDTMVYYYKGDTDFMISNNMSPGGCFLTADQEKELEDRKKAIADGQTKR